MQSTPPRARLLREREQLVLDTGAHRRSEVAAATDAGQISTWRPGILRLRALLVQRNTVWAIIAVSLMLCTPAIATGFILDDYFQTVALSDGASAPGIERAPWEAYSFASSSEQIHQMVEACVFPWWSDPQARLAFFRPLSSLTLWLDHQLWPKSPELMHIQSLVWYGLLLLVVAQVYRRFSARAFSLGFAGLALLLYGIDDAHAMTVGWLANRAALIALTFGFGALLAHDSWRSTGQKRYLFGALSLMALAFGCGEAAFQAVAYLAAYALCFDSGPKRARWKSLLPYAALLIVWRVIYYFGEYGAKRTTLYVDPAHDPIGFLQAMVVRLPVLLAAQLGGVSADLGDILRYAAPDATSFILPVCIATLAVCAWVIYPLWSTRREVRFWTLGTLLSTVPVCALAPADRLLIASGLGGSALIAIVLLGVLDRAREIYTPSRKFFAGVYAVIHLGIAPLLLPLQSYWLTYMESYIGDAERSIPDGAGVADKTVVLLNPPTDEFGIYMAHHRRVRGGVMPEHLRWIANGDSDLMVTRIDASSIKVRPTLGFLLFGAFGTLRAPEYKSQVGDVVQLSDSSITITAVTDDGRPAEVLVKFDSQLDSDKFVWLRWNNREGFEPFSLPGVGHSMLVPATDSRSVLVETKHADS